MPEQQMTVAQWLAVRERVADELRVAGSRSEAATRERLAERLMATGFVDPVRVLDAIEAERSGKGDDAED